MLQITQLKLPISHTEEQLYMKIRRILRLSEGKTFSYDIRKKSLDARKKNDKKFVYTVYVKVDNEKKLLNKVNDKNVMSINPVVYKITHRGNEPLQNPPVIIGSGPAGLFCAYFLAQAGYSPIILERGTTARERLVDVEQFWKNGKLNPNSNVQFGEGGAGTFSDGKLNTLVKDRDGRGRRVLEILVECGAKKEILYEQKPHLGTDELINIISNLRHKIEEMGGEFSFNSQVTDIIGQNNLKGVRINDKKTIEAQVAVLAIGHSARDTFEMLYAHGIHMEQKSFAVGVRIEHPQKLINKVLYGEEENKLLGSAAYKCTHKSSEGRGVYTFCMCPGGYVVNASSEPHHLAVNGMSYSGRDGQNANSAVVVTISSADFPSEHPLAGIEYQRNLEEKAWLAGQGCIPLQLYGDFKNNRLSSTLGKVTPCVKGKWLFGDVRNIFTETVTQSIEEGIEAFGKQIPGFNREDMPMMGVESRTSSPVRILRDDKGESSLTGLYPCGEGAGYAGGITSAAMDGMKIAEKIIGSYRPVKNIL